MAPVQKNLGTLIKAQGAGEGRWGQVRAGEGTKRGRRRKGELLG